MDSNNDTNTGQWAEDRLASLRSNAEWQPDTARGLSLLREGRTATALHAKRRAWTAAAMTAACVAILAFPLTRAFAQRCVDACAAVFSIRSTTAPSLRAQGFRVGSDRKLAPDFTLSDASGRAVKLSDFRGQVVLLDFWATWCVPCTTEIPWFVEFQQTYRDRGLAVLGVSFDDDGWKAVKPYLEAKRIDYPVMIGNDAVSDNYGVGSLPTTLLIDKEGRIAVTHVGLCGKNDYLAEIKTLLDEQR
jgi:peroxiredoxin